MEVIVGEQMKDESCFMFLRSIVQIKNRIYLIANNDNLMALL